MPLRPIPNRSGQCLADSFVFNVASGAIGAQCRQQTILRQAQNDILGGPVRASFR